MTFTVPKPSRQVEEHIPLIDAKKTSALTARRPDTSLTRADTHLEVVMQNRQSRALESLHNARAFLDANAEALPTVASSGMRQKLERTIDELTTHADAQGHHDLVAQGTTQQARNRRTSLLRDHMALIAGVAKVELKGTPEIEPLRMQKTRIRTPDLFRAATAMADAAEPFSSVFIGAGLPQDFIAQLLAAADAMMASVREREQSIGKRTGATTGISASSSSAAPPSAHSTVS